MYDLVLYLIGIGLASIFFYLWGKRWAAKLTDKYKGCFLDRWAQKKGFFYFYRIFDFILFMGIVKLLHRPIDGRVESIPAMLMVILVVAVLCGAGIILDEMIIEYSHVREDAKAKSTQEK